MTTGDPTRETTAPSHEPARAPAGRRLLRRPSGPPTLEERGGIGTMEQVTLWRCPDCARTVAVTSAHEVTSAWCLAHQGLDGFVRPVRMAPAPGQALAIAVATAHARGGRVDDERA
jgi:hypothetical protein